MVKRVGEGKRTAVHIMKEGGCYGFKGGGREEEWWEDDGVYSPESGVFGGMLCQLFFSRAKSD